uniref:Uncharacterized protein n=1 Tax=Arundo donax TaxID=35708 RepID=A0A0A9FQM0_ARUDO
MRHGSDRGL